MRVSTEAAVMDATEIAVRALNGDSVGVRFSIRREIASEITSSVRAKAGRRTLLFEAGRRSLAPHLMESIGADGFDASFDWQLGTLSVAEGTVGRSTANLAVWQGATYCVGVIVQDGSPEILVDLMDQFEITETDDGPYLRSSKPGFASLAEDEPQLAVTLPTECGLCVVEPLTRRRGRTLPDHSGAEVSGGELFKHAALPVGPEAEGNTITPLMLVSATAVATLVPLPGAQPHDIDLMSDMLVDWEIKDS